ncbi:MAG: hypothetical protein RRY39_00785 [Odoribacter sp.]
MGICFSTSGVASWFRSISAQREMWKVVEGTDMEDYVSNLYT